MAEAAAVFYYDLCSPYSWLVGERLCQARPEVEWQPVESSALGSPLWDLDCERVERLAEQFELPPVRWQSQVLPASGQTDGNKPEPHEVGGDLRTAALVACFTKQIGRTIAFSLAAFRQAFNAGRDIRQTDNLLIAAAACELHPRAILKALETASVAAALSSANAAAAAVGVTATPALSDGNGVIDTDTLLKLAANEFVGIYG